MEKKKRRFRIPILAKTILIIFVFSIVVVEIAMTYYSLVMSKRNQETYSNYADSLSSTIAKVIDTNDFTYLHDKVDHILMDELTPNERIDSQHGTKKELEDYIAHFNKLSDKENPEYDPVFVAAFNRVRNTLRNILDPESEYDKGHTKFDVDCAYVSYVSPYKNEDGKDAGYCVYLVDSAPDEDACPPGWLDPLYPINFGVINTPDKGFPAYTTNTGYGYLISAGTHIAGTERGYAFVDISMNTVRSKQAESIIRLFIYLVVTINLLAILGAVLVYFLFSRPLKRITKVAQSFDNNDPTKTHKQFTDLKVKTRDELDDLANSIKTMEEGVVQRINELVEVNNALLASKEQTEKMTAIAKRDSLTGVGSKTAYDMESETIDEQIKNKEKPAFGIAMVDLNYLKTTNDHYGHAIGDEALAKLANTICLVFKHSPVYRVGGDEFVVLLRGQDYQNANALVEEFKERIQDSIHNKKLDEKQRISAAIGCSIYDVKKDKCVEDVFKRADERMYQQKREMKGEE